MVFNQGCNYSYLNFSYRILIDHQECGLMNKESKPVDTARVDRRALDLLSSSLVLLGLGSGAGLLRILTSPKPGLPISRARVSEIDRSRIFLRVRPRLCRVSDEAISRAYCTKRLGSRRHLFDVVCDMTRLILSIVALQVEHSISDLHRHALGEHSVLEVGRGRLMCLIRRPTALDNSFASSCRSARPAL